MNSDSDHLTARSDQALTVQACIVDFAPAILAQLLKLPEGARITAVQQPVDRWGTVRMRIEGMGWDVRDGDFLRITTPIITTCQNQMLGDDSPRVVSVDWGCPLPKGVA